MVQDDKDILVLLAEDLDGNYETLWSTYFNQLYAFALRKTRNKDDAWDIIQEAFERAYRHLKGYPPQAVLTLKIRPWLYKITWNIYLNFVTRYKRPTSELIGISEDDFVYNLKNDQRSATNENALESDWRV